MHPAEIAVPLLARSRPRYHGLLVPFTVKWFDHVPDFKVTNEFKVKQCLEGRLCGLCGKRIDGPVTFLGGDRSMESRLFTDPAMHEDCARYAFAVCPYLNGSIETYREENRRDADRVVKLVSTQRPKRFGLLTTQSYRLVSFRGDVVIQAGRGRVVWLSQERTPLGT